MFKSNRPTETNEPQSSFYFTNKHQENPGDNIWYKMSPLEKKSGSHFWKLLKTIPFTELVLQSYSIQTYLWLWSSGEWLPEREKPQDLYKSAPIQLQFNCLQILRVLFQSYIRKAEF